MLKSSPRPTASEEMRRLGIQCLEIMRRRLALGLKRALGQKGLTVHVLRPASQVVRVETSRNSQHVAGVGKEETTGVNASSASP